MDAFDHIEEREGNPYTLMRRLRERAVKLIVPEENPAGAVYGLIVIGALLAAESFRLQTYLDAVASTALTVLVYWLAHAYATALGDRLEKGAALTMKSLIDGLRHDLSVVRGCIVPLILEVICWIAGARVGTGLLIAFASTIACMVGLEVLAGVRAHGRRLQVLIGGSVGASLGVAVVALRLLLH